MTFLCCTGTLLENSRLCNFNFYFFIYLLAFLFIENYSFHCLLYHQSVTKETETKKYRKPERVFMKYHCK